jgi:thiol-disulfide isomerase/thioredoxin
MTRKATVLLTALLFAGNAPRSFAAEQAGPPACDASGVCTADTNQPAVTRAKQIWASTRLYTDAPPLEVQKWLTGKPELEGKFVVVEFWRTWCGACKRMTPLMNTLHQKYGKELVVIGITGEAEETVKAYAGPQKEYFLALDKPQPVRDKPTAAGQPTASKEDASPVATLPDQAAGPTMNRPGQGTYEAAFGVWGWPHVIILEPQYRTVVWEGFTGLKGYELTEAKVAKILAIGRSMKEEEAAKKK